MGNSRLEQHPILTIAPRDDVPFTWDGRACTAKAGEVISSAVMAHGVRVFGHHPKDGSPQGLFCANGQCAQCLVLADAAPQGDGVGDGAPQGGGVGDGAPQGGGAHRGALPVKACMTPVTPGMRVTPLVGLPRVPKVEGAVAPREVERREVPVLIIGGGPAGLSAATELGRLGVPVLMVDDKDRLGGKLVLQTHRFFGSINAVYAGTRGIDIGRRLEAEATAFDTTEVWPSSTALAVFSDGWVGVLRGGDRYVLVRPRVLLVAAGSREKSLAFRGNTLPGVLGAGAFQTLLNRDQVRIADRLCVVGGGNVGLITAYHALQAGLEVVGLVEAAPACGGYAVHRDKLARLGVPIHTSHTVLSANGEGAVESVTIARVDAAFRPIAGTERSYACDTVLVAVGLDPVDEFTRKARDAGMTVFAAGDCDEIAEASAAMIKGKIRGLEIARELGADVDGVPPDWLHTAEVLRSKPGPVGAERRPPAAKGVHPVFHCSQEIPCNPCTSVCPQQLIHIDEDDIRHVPTYLGDEVAEVCLGCEKCVRICPGLAITLVDHRPDPGHPTVTIPLEFGADAVHAGDAVTVLDTGGAVLGKVEVLRVKGVRGGGGTTLVKVRAPADVASRIAGVRLQEPEVGEPLARYVPRLDDDDVVCRCERVTAGELRALIRAGHRDVNEIKAIVRAGMGACGAKTCAPLIERLFRDEGVGLAEVTPAVRRPLFVEVPLGVFAGLDGG